jgi:putative ABC transport system permease protein
MDNWATTAAILLALGVLAMTVGLVRSETAGDLRVLTATGAGSRIRRTITGATAGALGLLGAVVGTSVAYLAAVCYFRSQLDERLSHVPVLDLVLIVVGFQRSVGSSSQVASRRPFPTSRSSSTTGPAYPAQRPR